MDLFLKALLKYLKEHLEYRVEYIASGTIEYVIVEHVKEWPYGLSADVNKSKRPTDSGIFLRLMSPERARVHLINPADPEIMAKISDIIRNHIGSYNEPVPESDTRTF